MSSTERSHKFRDWALRKGLLWSLIAKFMRTRISQAAAAIGDPKIVRGLLQPLAKTVFKDRAPKMRVRDADGKATIAQPQIPAAPAA